MPEPFKLRITRTLSEADNDEGVDVSRFKPGYVYLVGTTVATYLLAIDAAIPAAGDEPALMLPAEAQLFGPPPIADRRVRPRAETRERRQSSMRTPLLRPPAAGGGTGNPAEPAPAGLDRARHACGVERSPSGSRHAQPRPGHIDSR